ncbi:recombinase family protein [Tuanshanicoccus lijuaniae]|uniref:recombinase family protein n=1 Tax=Aerococcaceae bacterium zg-1292 TaxID=2774330 RepID=UPI0019354915|nr:recombinase family protein [Aerococcaceae bacterium zg-1292]QQA38065.1 recombinase family protein [Aerococcaceae bacterium zg-1292]
MGRITKIEPCYKKLKSKKVRVAAYARVSTDSDEQLLSLETQKEHYQTIIQTNPSWEYVGLYVDEGISGTSTEKRQDLQRLLTDCEQGKIDRVMTKSISRFSRNTVDCLEMIRKLSSLGVYLYFEKENIDTEKMSSELMVSILSSIAESESHSISENSKWSIKRRFEIGTYIIATPPYGYQNVAGTMMIIPEEAEVVKEIFRQSISGMGTYLIAKALNSRSIPTKRGGVWHSSTVQKILTNLSYTGYLILQKTYTDENFGRHTNYGEEDQYMIRNHHEAIISHEDFELAQKGMEQRALDKGITTGEGKYHQRYALSGKIKCGCCGTSFKRRVRRKNSGKVIFWACKEHIKHKENCSMQSVDEHWIQQAYMQMMNKLAQCHPVVLKPFVEGLRGSNQKQAIHEVVDIDSQLAKLNEQQQVMMQLFASGYLERDVFYEENLQLQHEIDDLENQKQILSNIINGDLTHLQEAKKLLRFVSSKPKIDDFNHDEFSEAVERITILARNRYIFHLKCGLNFTEEVELK